MNTKIYFLKAHYATTNQMLLSNHKEKKHNQKINYF